MKENKMSMVVSAIIVLIVIAVLVFITINKGGEQTTQIGGTEQQNMQNTQQTNGVKITILKEGAGDTVKLGDTVAMNYMGKLADGTVFDSNIDPKFGHVQPLEFQIGDKGPRGVIEGWNIGVTGMKVGEKRVLEIAPELAYGSNGAGGIIPPNATLTFEVELLQIKK